MEKTWRWFGPNDKITLDMLRQIGVEGIVTALHHIPNGEIWSEEEVVKMKNFIEEHGLRWSVVESLPVSESIKYGGSDRDQLIENYKESLRNLGKAGIKTICYNFMPVLDWARTDLEYPNPDGTSNLYFNRAEFAYFDINILKRENAAQDYDEETLRRMREEVAPRMDKDAEHRLVENIIVKTQGFVNGNITEDDLEPVNKFRELLELYKGIDADRLRANMAYFLNAIMPVCDEYGIDMCVHPDDPPMPILGLPRILSTAEDFRKLVAAVPNASNGLCLCTGSFGVRPDNDLPAMMREFGDRVGFVHLRSTHRDADGNFYEDDHLAGDVPMYEVMKAFLEIQQRRKVRIPMRPDHGHQMCDDLNRRSNPGYSCYGRLRGLAELRGLELGIAQSLFAE